MPVPPKPESLEKAFTDAISFIPDGMNMGIDPALLPRTQLAYASNTTVRGTLPIHRPAFNQVPLTFSGGIQTAVETGIFQGACFYKPDSGFECLIASISGRIYKFTISGATCTVTDITPAAGANLTTLTQSWAWQSECFTIINNGQNTPIIYDGVTARRAHTGTEQPFILGAGAGSFATTTNGAFIIPPVYGLQATPTGTVVVPSATPTNIALSANYGGNNGDIITVPSGVQFTVNSGAGTATINVTQSSGANVTTTTATPFTIYTSHMVLTVAYAGANNNWLACSYTVAGLKYYIELFVVTGSGSTSIQVQQFTGATVTIPSGSSVRVGNISGTANLYPGLNQTIQVAIAASGINANGTYPGPWNIVLQAWYVRASAPTIPVYQGRWLLLPPPSNTISPYNATLTNVNDTTGNTVGAGAAVVTTSSSTTWLPFAQVNTAFNVSIPPGGQNTVSLTAPYHSSYGTQVKINGVVFNLISPADMDTRILIQNTGTTTVTVTAGQTVYYSGTYTTTQTIGIVGQAFTVPTVGDAVNIQLSPAYAGVNGASVSINGKSYTITQYTSPAQNPFNVTLVQLDNVTGGFTHEGFAYMYFSYMPELPVGMMGAYSMGRNWIALPHGRSYWASDLVGDSSGTLTYNYRDAVLKSTENTYLNGGGAFAVPSSAPNIRAIFGTAQLDASLGQGPLGIATDDTVFSNQAPADRTTWQNLTFPIQSVSLLGGGSLSQWATVAVNGDTMMRDTAGIRSLVMARRDFNVWGNVPASREVGPLLASDTPSLLNWCSGIEFDNRYLVTQNPTLSTQGVYHTGIIAQDQDPLSSLRGKLPAVYDGLWTGLNVLQLVTGKFQGVTRAFAFHLNLDAGAIELWEITTSGADQPYDNGTTPITMRMETAVLFNQSQNPRDRKRFRLMGGELQIDDMQGPVQFKVYFKPDQYPNWVPWYSWTEQPDPTIAPGFKPRIGLPEPSPSLMDPSTNRPLREGYQFQMAIVITGHCRWRGCSAWATEAPQTMWAQVTGGGTTQF